MNYCTNCGAKIIETTKYCINCGTPIDIISSHDIEEKKELSYIETKAPRTSKLTKTILGIIIGIALLFMAKVILLDTGVIKNTFASDSALNRIVGKWHDPTGVILGDKKAIITFRKKGDVVVGEDKNNKIYIQLLSAGGLNYQGLVVLNGIDGNFEVHYYKDEGKLVFFSTLTKTSWNIRKVNK